MDLTNINIAGIGPESNHLLPYLTTIYPLFNIVEGRHIMEIGPQFGWHTSLSMLHNPTSVTLIENDKSMVDFLKENFKNESKVVVIHDDIFHNLTHSDDNYDVVICCGILYHFHSPLYLLELIANQCNPTTVIIEYPVTTDDDLMKVSVEEEKINILAERWINDNWKPVKFKLVISNELLVDAMHQLGYLVTTVIKDLRKSNRLFDFYVFNKI